MIRLDTMNDTNAHISDRHNAILRALRVDTLTSSSQVRQKLVGLLAPSEMPALITVKRDLDELTDTNYCQREGSGRSTAYRLTTRGLLERSFPIETYIGSAPDDRTTFSQYYFPFFAHLPDTILSTTQKQTLDDATATYRERTAAATPVARAKELERFIIELSWKSSAIEGNTYTLLDTERLLTEGIRAPNHDPAEAHMILNHKHALQFVMETIAHTRCTTIDQRLLEQIHELLIQDLGVAAGLRKTLVGITGSAYTPLDNQYQIQDALSALFEAVAKLTHPVEKALLTLAGLSYIQPFEDGNKRTARLTSNAILLAHDYAPLSYRNVDIERYRSAMLLFYEQLSIVAVRDIFLDQYLFSTKHYLV